MPYLLDSNTFIQPKNQFYGFDICPAYWDWLIRENRKGTVYSVEAVKKELMQKDDPIKKWINTKCGDEFFLKPDRKTAESIALVADWVDKCTDYKQAVKNEFYAAADIVLIAHAHAHRFEIVTFEKDDGAKKSVKIPTVCNQLHVNTIDLWALLNREGARFVLE